MSSTHDLEELVSALAAAFGVPKPRLVLHHVSTMKWEEGKPRQAVYLPKAWEIHAWVHTRQLVAHEFGHHLCLMYGRDWPVTKDSMAAAYQAKFSAAERSLEKDKAAYEDDELEEELFARVFHRVYKNYL